MNLMAYITQPKSATHASLLGQQDLNTVVSMLITSTLLVVFNCHFKCPLQLNTVTRVKVRLKISLQVSTYKKCPLMGG